MNQDPQQSNSNSNPFSGVVHMPKNLELMLKNKTTLSLKIKSQFRERFTLVMVALFKYLRIQFKS